MEKTDQQPKGMENTDRIGQKSIMEQMPGVYEKMPPEMQQAFVKAVSLGVIAFYSEKFLPKARDMMQAGQDPAAGIGRIVAMIGARIYHSARKAGQDIPGEVLLLAGAELVREVCDYGEEKMGLKITEETVKDAMLAASQNFQASMKGQGPQVQASAEDYERMVQMAGGPEALQALSERMKTATVPFDTSKMGGQSKGLDRGAPAQPGPAGPPPMGLGGMVR